MNREAHINPTDSEIAARAPVAKKWKDVAVAERDRLSRLQEAIERHRECPSCAAPVCMADVIAANDNIWLETHPGEA